VIAMIRSSGSLPSARNWSVSQGAPADPDRPATVLAVEGHVAAGAVDVGHELPAPRLHELVDPSTGAVQGLNDRANARLLFDHGEQPEQLDLLVPALGPTQDDLRQAQYVTGVKTAARPS
jgi:hypothetical protein